MTSKTLVQYPNILSTIEYDTIMGGVNTPDDTPQYGKISAQTVKNYLSLSTKPTKIWYVSIDGDDANDGSLLQPFLTFTQACSVAQEGDIIQGLITNSTEDVEVPSFVILQGITSAPLFQSLNGVTKISGTITLNNGSELKGISIEASSFQAITAVSSSAGYALVEDCYIQPNESCTSGVYFESTDANFILNIINSVISVPDTTTNNCLGISVSNPCVGAFNFINSTAETLDDNDALCISLAGSVNFNIVGGTITGQIVAQNSSNIVLRNSYLQAGSVSCLNLSASSSATIATVYISTNSDPVIEGTGAISCSNLMFLGTGNTLSNTLNAGAGATVLKSSLFNLPSQPLVATLQNGLIEYNGTNLYFTSGAQRYALQAQGSKETFIPTLSGTATYDPLLSSFTTVTNGLQVTISVTIQYESNSDSTQASFFGFPAGDPAESFNLNVLTDTAITGNVVLMAQLINSEIKFYNAVTSGTATAIENADLSGALVSVSGSYFLAE